MSSQKRKGPSTDGSAWRNKRQKTQRDARTLAVQTSSKAFQNGALDVGAFVKAREYEIRALEEGMGRARKGLTQRAFQQVPKDLRRRTASHNAKRVPKRLRPRAVREMTEDNTPTVTSRRRKPTSHMRLRMDTVKRLRALATKQTKDASISTRPPKVKENSLADAPRPPAKFRKRQLHKTWLPTHLFHAKRAHMTLPSRPLWRFAIPLTPTAKSYRPTHRAAKDRGAIAWDTSYMSCISLEANENSIRSLLRALSVGSPDDVDRPWDAKGRNWRLGSRTWQGWLYERDHYPDRPIAPATVIWRPEPQSQQEASKAPQRQVLIRVHPSAFLQLWEHTLVLAKIQKPQVAVEDLRFEIGSIEVVGPSSTEALTAALWPVQSPVGEGSVYEKTWPSLASVQDPAVLPSRSLLAFDIVDPRLHHPPRTVEHGTDLDGTQILDTLANWPFDQPQQASGLFSRKKRQAACRALPSQKAISRRRAAAPPGSYPEPAPKDAQIPVLAFPSPIQPGSKRGAKSRKLHSWTVLLPWKAVSPVWQSLMYYPVSTGGQVRLGGLNEQRQIAFETGVPWFPADHPGTKAGDDWEAMESAKRKARWEGKPKGKRVEFDSVTLGPGSHKGEVGSGWACDWSHISPPPNDAGDTRGNGLYHRVSGLANATAENDTDDTKPKTAITTVRITLLGRGTPEPCARIYRLPTPSSPEATALRSRWLSLNPSRPESQTQHRKRQRGLPPSVTKNTDAESVQRALAADLTLPPRSPETSEEQHPDVPGKEDLIGFVTSGEFCLTEGRGVAIGSVAVGKMGGVEGAGEEAKICIVRNAGERMGRLGRVEFV